MTGPRREWLIGAVIALAVLAVYAPVRDFPFVVYDDKILVSENPPVLEGLGVDGVVWAFTHAHQGNYVPLSWLSHMLDVELFGLDAGGHHAMNALLHLVASLLLFAALRALSADVWPSAFVALIFAVHPAHVESVAWVSERRDTLSAVFWMLVMLAYAGYVRASDRRLARYLLVLALLALGLLAKPMLMTLPAVLLLLDFWPLRRAEPPARLMLEKVPMLALCAAALLGSALAQQTSGAMAAFAQVPPGARLANAALSYAAYLGKSFWPTDLAVFYPYDLALPLARVAGAALLLLVVSGAALYAGRRRPWLAVGWLWYLGTLVPVIGLVQVGSQAMADRYTYLPMIGLSIAVAWSGAELATGRPRAGRALALAAALALGAAAFLAREQVGTWRSSVALFEHALAVSGDEPVIHLNLAEAWEEEGRDELALEHYRRTLELAPDAPRARTRAALLLARRGRWAAALKQHREAIRRRPDEREARLELGIALLRLRRVDEAAAALEGEVALDPENARAQFHLAEATAVREGSEPAARRFREAFRLDPELPDDPIVDANARVCAALSTALSQQGRSERATHWAKRALILAQLDGDLELAARLREQLGETRGNTE